MTERRRRIEIVVTGTLCAVLATLLFFQIRRIARPQGAAEASLEAEAPVAPSPSAGFGGARLWPTAAHVAVVPAGAARFGGAGFLQPPLLTGGPRP